MSFVEVLDAIGRYSCLTVVFLFEATIFISILWTVIYWWLS